MRFTPLPADPCIFRRGTAFIIIWVDDLLIVDDTEELINAIQAKLAESYELKVIGEPARLLGCAVECDYEEGRILLSQQAYAADILTEYGMEKCTGSDIITNPSYMTYRVKLEREKLAKAKDNPDNFDDSEDATVSDYATILARTNWLVTKARPDTVYAVFRMQRRMAAPVNFALKQRK
jgi:hypothetical protein